MSFDLSETFSQINAAGQASIGDVNVSITSGGNIIGQGVTASTRALNVSGGNLDAIIHSFGGSTDSIQGGGKDNIKRKVDMVMDSAKHHGSKMDKHLEKQLKELHDHAVDLEEFAVLAKSALKEPDCTESLHDVLSKIVSHVDSGARAMRSVLEKDLKQPKQNVAGFLARNKQFTEAIRTLGAQLNEPNAAGMVSLSFSNVNELQKMGKEVEQALKAVDMKKKEYLGQSLANLDRDLTHKLEEVVKRGKSSDKLRDFLQGWSTLLAHHGHAKKLENHIKGAGVGNNLADRLRKSREEVKNIINKFIAAFSSDLNGIVNTTNELSKHLGKDISYTDETTQFLDAFVRLNEYLNDNNSKFYQHLLEINMDQIDSKEIKARFLNNLRVLSERAAAMGSSSALKSFVSSCDSAVETVHKFSDLIKTFREEMKKEGGNATDTMNELYSVDASKIEISTIVNSLENLAIAIKKLQFFKNIAIFRSNLQQTNKELSVYSADYEKSVGKSIGEAISRITNEYNEIINQVSDNKSGMGLEIDMYNESLDSGNKISKEKLKVMYKWQCDARVGLYKTIEAIDLYLLHFTDAVTKNPDAVSDLHKLLSATRIIARWYDQKAGQNIIRVFESFRDGVNDEEIDADAFITQYNDDVQFADLSKKLGGDRASKLYERCRRAVQGVVVLKNIISYFMSLGEKYGDFKSEKSIYMAPSNIYKNLVNYIWVSALDINTTGTEVLTDNNETKRLLTYEDTKVRIAEINDINPDTMGLNFNRHSIDKLRILKCHNELLRLRDSTASLDQFDIRRVKQFVSGIFARLGKTKYIFPMFLFGVYDLSQMDKALLTEFKEYVTSIISSGINRRANLDGQIDNATDDLNAAQAALDAAVAVGALADVINPLQVALAAAQTKLNNLRAARNVSFDSARQGVNMPIITFISPNLPAGVPLSNDNFVATIMTLTPEQRSLITTRVNYNVDVHQQNTFINLKQFMNINEESFAASNGIAALNGMASAGTLNRVRTDQRNISAHGFLQGFLAGITSSIQESSSIAYAARIVAVLHYCVMDMLNTFKRTQSNSIFAVDDTYFILAIKAVAGKVMTIAGVNSLFKNPAAYRNVISQNKTRIIMGGADSILEDPEVIDDAVELYVRLPLLMEFYRSIFDNANKDYKSESLNEISPLDEERISFVPEIGNIWSNLIKNIFDKSKHIENGVYTPENMRKIISEINAIYNHYKSAAPSETLTRHIILQLVAEINRRYGVIKRQDLLNYYRVINSTKRSPITINETSYSNNDFDILNETIEFEEKSPSDAFINLKSTLADKNVSSDTKINKLTDYKILKDFRDRINNIMKNQVNTLHSGNDAANDFLTIVDRIRMLKKAVASKSSRDEKYDMIIKAIEESEAMNQSSNDIFACFHELVIVPMRMAYHMYQSLDQFILAIYSVFSRVAENNDVIPGMLNNPVLKSKVKIGAIESNFLEAIKALAVQRELVTLADADRVFRYGRKIAKFSSVAADRSLTDMADEPINTGTAQILLTDIMSHFCQNSGNLVKMTISTTGRITIDMSEFQTLCEYLISNTKFMVDKFTGLVPKQLIENVTNPNKVGTIYWLEDNLINKMFNKINKNERERALASVDNLNKIMPLVSNAIFNGSVSCSKLITELMLNRGTDASFKSVNASEALPVIRDAFMQYDQASRVFKITGEPTSIFNTLFAANADSSIVEKNLHHGLIQEFNTLIAHYLNDLYDAQARKMYPKLFERFANNAFIEALNGQAFADFGNAAAFVDNKFYDLPTSHGILSATLAYTMKTMSNRTHPISGVKIHENTSIQEVSAHVLEKYRACLPMYMRLFGIFLERCKLYRKTISKLNIASGNVTIDPIITPVDTFINDGNSVVRDNLGENFNVFATKFESINDTNASAARDKLLLFIDDMVNGISSLVEDATSVHKELRELDRSVPLFFDIKHDFTKTFYVNTKELPYAPLSTLTMGFNTQTTAIQPFPTTSQVNNFKFLYGMQSMLIDNFKVNTSKVPYMKKLLADFNGYNTKINNISEDKFNDMLKYLGQAFNFYYDWKFFNGRVFGDINLPANAIADQLADNVQSVSNDLRTALEQLDQFTAERNALVEPRRIADAAVAAAPADAAALAERDRLDALDADLENQVNTADTAVRDLIRAENPAGVDVDAVIARARTFIQSSGRVPQTYQEVQSRDASLTLIESINPTDSKNKVAEFIKTNFTKILDTLKSTDGANPRARVIMVNIIDLGIVPINVHSLMREIPLTNLYNYAMTFDQFVDELDVNAVQKLLLKSPYTRASVVGDAADNFTLTIGAVAAAQPLSAEGIAFGGDTSLRFLKDVIFDSVSKPTKQGSEYNARVEQRINSKLLRNMTFLTLVQYAIKKKVKQELDFINSRVVSDVAAVSNVITNASVDVSDSLFEF